MRQTRALIAALLFYPASVLAQTPAETKLSSERLFANTAAVSFQAPAPRSGFTVLVNLGVGVQSDSGLESTAVGLAGANLGLGGFLTTDLALMFRFSGTNVIHDDFFGSFRQISGVLGGTVQFWPAERFAIEVGGGMGFWSAEESQETSFGLILGGSGVVFKRGGHNLLVGGEYAPAFTESGAVHNIGFTFGYQFHRY